MLIPDVPAQPDSMDEYDWQTLRAARCGKRRRQAGFSQDGDGRAVFHGMKSFPEKAVLSEFAKVNAHANDFRFHFSHG